jgi:uncharacterized protein (TIRG00374 family)
VKIGVSLGLLVVLLRTTNLGLFRDRLADVRPGWILAAFLGYLLGQVLSACKWRVLAKPLGFPQSFFAFISYYFAGMYLNLFAPSTVAGDFGRSALLAQRGERLSAAVQSVVADRISGFAMLLWVAALGALLSDATAVPGWWKLGVVGSAVGVTVGWLFLPAALKFFFRQETSVRRRLEQFVGPYRRAPGLLLRACGLSLGFHVLQIGLQLLLVHALQIELSVWYLFFCGPMINILSNLPISFSGLGVREGSCVLFFSFVGVPEERALAFGLLWSALSVGANVSGGLALLFSPTARLPLSEFRKMPDE